MVRRGVAARALLLAFLVLLAGVGLASELSPQQDDSGTAGEKARHPQFVFDSSTVLIFVVATLTLVVAGLSSRTQTRSEMDRLRQKLSDGEGDRSSEGEEEPAVVVSEKMAVFIVIQATVGLLLMYFLLSKIFFTIVLVFYALIAVQAIWVQSTFLFENVVLKKAGSPRWLEKSVDLPIFGRCQMYQLISLLLGLAVSVTWACVRTWASWAWVLQDISGICVILTILMFLKLPSLRIACILLPLIMMYDVFFVYIQPLIFHNESVMKKVATGGSTHEILPMALILPNLGRPGAFALLGYGDIALPGLLICYAASYDEVHRLKGLLKTYAPIELAGYVLGLAATYAALALDIGGQQGQPALLYLVPATLVPMLVAAHLRGDLKDMMHANLPFLEARGGSAGQGLLLVGEED